MFKKYSLDESYRRVRRLLDGKVTYRKLLVVVIVSCLLFLWILSKFFFSPEVVKGEVENLMLSHD